MQNSQNGDQGDRPHSFSHRDWMNVEYVSVSEAAMRARISKHTIYRWIARGWLPAYGHGHALRVLMGDVLARRVSNRA